MTILKNIGEYSTYFDRVKADKKSIGFVPTMGALHDGHLSLIHSSKANNDITVSSIFVNPTQFNENSDYLRYPRDLDRDIEILESAGCDALFSPSESEMYPKEDNDAYLYWKGNIREVNLTPLDTVMEGKYRPGHFDGVIAIVQKLFYIVRPDTAYFGEKDHQQLAIIRRMTEELDLGIDIVGCPIIRESDGLAMSSRNALLSKEQRAAAIIIYNTLKQAQTQLHSKSVRELCNWISDEINAQPLCEVQYVEIADPDSLVPILECENTRKAICCVAVYLDSVRLIDNISLFP